MSAFWVLRDVKVRANLIQYLLSFQPSGQTVTIGKKLHSSPQQRYFHMLCDILDDSLGHKSGYHKMKFKFQTLPLETVQINTGEKFLYPISSREANKDEYGKMIELALIEGSQAGLIMPDPSTLGFEI